MPLFEFICRKCDTRFDELCKPDARPPMCPSCGSTDTEKLISLPGPLKKGAFPYKPGPVHPLAKRMMSGQGRAACPAQGGCNPD